jgi:hypothetical protein
MLIPEGGDIEQVNRQHNTRKNPLHVTKAKSCIKRMMGAAGEQQKWRLGHGQDKSSVSMHEQFLPQSNG